MTSTRAWSWWVITALVLPMSSGLAAQDTPPPPDAPPESPPEAAPQETPHADPAPPRDNQDLPRVIVHVNHGNPIAGFLVNQSERGLTVRTIPGQTNVISHDAITRVERLLVLHEPMAGTVTRTNGQVLTGMITADRWDTVSITLESGLALKVPREKVHAVALAEPFEKRYERMARLLPLKHQAAHLALCRWLVAEQAWPEAVSELEAHVRRYRAPRAAEMLRLANAHLNMRTAPATPEAPNDPAQPEPTPSHLPPPVSESDVNLIRVYEVDLANPPRLRIDEQTRRDLLAAYPGSSVLPESDDARTAFINGRDVDVLGAMFALRARPFYTRVNVPEEPIALRRFRQNVHDQWLITRCGSTACHGGDSGGRLLLHTARQLNDQVRTSNLLILDALNLDGRPMIDWDNPMNSLLVQHALPRDLADDPHPAVDGFRPAFSSPRAGPVQATTNWIESMMRSPRPDYPVEPPLPPTPGKSPGESPGESPGKTPGQGTPRAPR